jgi:hypothetical protein
VAVHAFQLDRVCSAPDERRHGRDGGGHAAPVRQERQVGDDELAGSRPGDGAGMHRHHADRGREGGVVAMDDHRDRIAYQDGVNARARDKARRPRIVGGDDRDSSMFGFGAGEIVDGFHIRVPVLGIRSSSAGW